MSRESNTTIKVAQILAPIVSSRDIIDELTSYIEKASSKKVVLDFTNVEFVSRSAAHELLVLREELQAKWFNKKEIIFENTNKDVSEMLRMVAANRAVPKNKPDFHAEHVSIQSLLNDTI